MIISGLMANTSYTCCVFAHSELGTSESVCDTVNTGMCVHVCKCGLSCIIGKHYYNSFHVHIENGMSNTELDKQAVSTVFLVSTVVQVAPSCTVDIEVTPCNAEGMNSHAPACHCSSVS